MFIAPGDKGVKYLLYYHIIMHDNTYSMMIICYYFVITVSGRPLGRIVRLGCSLSTSNISFHWTTVPLLLLLLLHWGDQ